ncbi:hypothetical protein OAS86_06600, partial [Gammaproteobacteria bacterium]|nr:hypothetical protein [Gammaproteobacteria bacterium]
MATNTAIRRRLLLNFGVPALTFVVITCASVIGSRWFLTDVLLREGLRQEAQFYWSRFDDGRLSP